MWQEESEGLALVKHLLQMFHPEDSSLGGNEQLESDQKYIYDGFTVYGMWHIFPFYLLPFNEYPPKFVVL